MYENHSAPKIMGTGSNFNPRFGADMKAASDCAQQGGIVAGVPIPMAPLQEYVQMLDTRLSSLQNTLYLLSDRLVPVMYPAPPETATQSTHKDSGAPILVAIDMASLRLIQMQQQVDNLLSRLVI